EFRRVLFRSLVGSLTLPVLLRGRLERWAPAFIPSLAIIGTIGLMLAPQLILLWAPMLGMSSGATLGMTLTLISQRARDHDASAALSGMSQSVGYVVASFGPIAFGTLHTLTGGWEASLGLLLMVLVGLVVVGVFAGRERYVLDGRRAKDGSPVS